MGHRRLGRWPRQCWGRQPIAFSGPLVRIAGVGPDTAAVFRCVYAVPILAIIARRERRRLGARSARQRAVALAAGVSFGVNLALWHRSIETVGAGLATVLANLQVVVVALLAWLVLRERPARRLLAGIPLALGGVVLLSGLLERGAYGTDPQLGVVYGLLTAVAYSMFLLILRGAGRGPSRPAGPLADATLVAGVVTASVGFILGDLQLEPKWPAHGWLLALALGPQVGGWLLTSRSLPRLPAALTSAVLLIQPAGALVVGMVALAEKPSPLQLSGTGLVLAAVAMTIRSTRTTSGKRPAPGGFAAPERLTVARRGRTSPVGPPTFPVLPVTPQTSLETPPSERRQQ